MRPPPMSLLRDTLLVAGIAVLTVNALRRFVGDRYLVPTGSMEPVLHGHPVRGDIVFVDKTASAMNRRVHDLVVVTQPADPSQQMVKRIAAVGDDQGGCWIELREGDVWLGPDAGHLVRQQKDPLAARAMRVLWASWPGPDAAIAPLGISAATPESDGLRLPAAVGSEGDARAAIGRAGSPRQFRLPDGFVGSNEPIDAAYIDADGVRGQAGADVAVSDVGLDIEFAALQGQLVATADLRGEALTFCWQPASGRVQLWQNGADVATHQLPANPAPRRLEFGLLDGRLFFAVDGDAAQTWVAARPTAPRGQRPPRAYVHLGVIGGADAFVRLRSLRVFHDVFAYREPIVGRVAGDTGWPRYVPPGHWFLLGDSAFDSRDSREFGPVPTRSFLGVPRCVLGPWSRRRWVVQ